MFSVVIPLYNKAHTIEHTLASVLNQTFEDFEVLIVNDGSTDDGVKVIKNFSSDPRIRIINQENQGVSAARNRGVAESKYDYIAFLDGDDAWMPGFLEKIKEAIQKHPDAGMFGTSSIHIDYVTGEEHDSTLQRYKNKTVAVEYFENPGTMPHTSAMVVKKDIFFLIDINGEGFPVGMKCCEDWSCFYRIAFNAPFIYIGKPLGIRYNNVPGQITGISQDERFKLLKHVVDFYNLTFKTWNDLDKPSMNYKLSLKYDIRHRVLSALKISDYRTVNYLLDNLEKEIIQIIGPMECKLYQKRFLRLFVMAWIYGSKLIWRRHGFPVVGAT